MDHDIANGFAQRLQEAMRVTKTRKVDLYSNDDLNISRSTLNKWLLGAVHNPNKVTVKAVASFMGVNYDWLMFNNGEMSQPARILPIMQNMTIPSSETQLSVEDFNSQFQTPSMPNVDFFETREVVIASELFAVNAKINSYTNWIKRLEEDRHRYVYELNRKVLHDDLIPKLNQAGIAVTKHNLDNFYTEGRRFFNLSYNNKERTMKFIRTAVTDITSTPWQVTTAPFHGSIVTLPRIDKQTGAISYIFVDVDKYASHETVVGYDNQYTDEITETVYSEYLHISADEDSQIIIDAKETDYYIDDLTHLKTLFS